MGGDISVTSQPGHGTTFSFHITCQPVPEKSPAKAPKKKAARKTGRSGASTRVVYAEDNESNQELMRALLADMRIKPTIVDDGEALASELDRNTYDLILLDLQLPGISGIDLCRKIRRGECGAAHKEIPIVGVTAFALAGDRERCIQAGMNDYISKPIRPQAMRELLYRYTRKNDA